MNYKGRVIEPYESFYWNDTEAFFRGQCGISALLEVYVIEVYVE